MQLIINPGSGPVADDACFQEATANMEVLKCEIVERTEIQDIQFYATTEASDGGRYSFVLNVGGRAFDIDMPGIPLERVRYVKESNESCWNFPRLYVDGSSWLWCYAVNVIAGSLNDKDE